MDVDQSKLLGLRRLLRQLVEYVDGYQACAGFVFLALAIFSERVILVKISAENPQALDQFCLALHLNLILGVWTLLLIAIAQIA